MSWIDDRLSEKKTLEERSMRIYSEAPRIHGELWKEILAQIEEAKSKGFEKILMMTAGEILLPVVPAPGPNSANPKKLSLQLKTDHTALVAKISGTEFALPLEVDGGQVVIKHEGKTLSVQNLAVVILDRFLFPDLKRLDVNHITAWKGPFTIKG
jgi:hypothetical protein